LLHQEIATHYKAGIPVYPEPVPTGVEAAEWNQIDSILDYAVDIFAASRVMGFREGIERVYAALTIGVYYETYPERLLIAKYIRQHHDATNQEICEYVDEQEGARVASMTSNPQIKHPRPYPLPWESKPLEKRTSLTMHALEQRVRWSDALDKTDKTKNKDLGKVKYLRSFLSKEKHKALHDKNAQMYFAWRRAAAKGMVIERDGFRQVTFGDSWRHLQSICPDIISPRLEKALREREREGAEQGRAPNRSYRQTLGDLGDL
jgi:hypothetical protein